MSSPDPSSSPAAERSEALDAASPALVARPEDLDEAMAQLEAARFDESAGVGAAEQHPAAESPEEARARVLAFCRANPDALHRSCLAGHLTGSAVVIDAAGERTLLLHHAKLGRWLQPGGHADGDGNLANVALREATEETGMSGLRVVRPAIDVDIHTIPARPGEPEHLHLDVRFAVIAPADAAVEVNHESLGARWVEPQDPEVADAPDLARAVNRAVRVVRQLR